MNGDKQHAVWRESIEKYGKTTQSIVCMEECSELIQAVSKRLRGKSDYRQSCGGNGRRDHLPVPAQGNVRHYRRAVK